MYTLGSYEAYVALRASKTPVDLLTSPDQVRGFESFGISVRNRRLFLCVARHGQGRSANEAERIGHILTDE